MSTKKETAEAEAPIRETRAAEKKEVQDVMTSDLPSSE